MQMNILLSRIGCLITITTNNILMMIFRTLTIKQTSLYEAFGGIIEQYGNSENNHLAYAKERDKSISLNNHGFRYYDASIGRYISNDPLGYEGGFNLYVHCTNDPINKFDPLGLNDLIVSDGIHIKKDEKVKHRNGQERIDTHDSNPMNFVKAALVLIDQKQKAGSKEPIEWAVQRSSYEDRAVNDGKDKDAYTKEIAKEASDRNVIVRWFDNKEELKDTINNTIEGNPRAESGQEKIKNMDVFGHGVPGEVWTQYEGGEENSLTKNDIKGIDPSAFKEGAEFKSWSCNTATKTKDEGKSFAETFTEQTGVKSTGLFGRSDYAPTAPAGRKETLAARAVGFAISSLFLLDGEMTSDVMDDAERNARKPSLPVPGTKWDEHGGGKSEWVEFKPQQTRAKTEMPIIDDIDLPELDD